MQENFHRKKHLTSFQMIHIRVCRSDSFGNASFVMLPVSSADGIVTPFDEALFTSTSAVCVTGACCTGHRQLLVRIWSDSYSYTYTDRWAGSSDSCCRCIYAFRKKNISYATQHYAERNIGTAGRRNCPVDKFILRGTFWLRRLEQFYFSRYFAMILGGGESGCPYFIQYLHFAMPGLTYWEQKGTGLYLFRIWR